MSVKYWIFEQEALMPQQIEAGSRWRGLTRAETALFVRHNRCLPESACRRFVAVVAVAVVVVVVAAVAVAVVVVVAAAADGAALAVAAAVVDEVG
jgi:hypothetical protein